MKETIEFRKYYVSIIDTSYLLSFLLLFVFGGAMAFVGIPFRPYMVLFFAMSTLCFSKIRINRILILYIILFLEIILSALLNDISTLQLLLFLRSLIFSFLIYVLADAYFKKQQVSEKLFKWCSILGLIQLPIIVSQKYFYSQLMKISAEAISYWDIGSGTFFIKNDSVTSIFLMGLVIIYLFNQQLKEKYRFIKVIVFVLGIFAAGSRICQLATLFILAFSFLRNLNVKGIIYLGILFLIGAVFLIKSTIFIEFKSQMELALGAFDFSNVDARALNKFENGQYSRAAAVLYYISQPFKFFGDGPSAYYNVISREHLLGNTGHVFTFYSEIGAIGLVLSYLIYFEFCKHFSDNKLQRNTYFLAICLLSITSNIYTDTGIVFAFLTLLCLQNISTKQNI